MPESNQKSEVRSTLIKYAGRLLNARPYFRSKLKRKLLQKAELMEVSEENLINEIILDLEKAGFLNDHYLAKGYIKKQLTKLYGPRIITLKLKHLGVSSALIKECFQDSEVNSQIKEAIKALRAKYQGRHPREISHRIYMRGFLGSNLNLVFDDET